MKEYQLHGLRALAQSPKGTVPAFLQAPATQGAWRFHHALEDYGPTPLVRLNGLAEELGLGGVFVKDESHRFGLNAFKGLGGIYALSRAVARLNLLCELCLPYVKKGGAFIAMKGSDLEEELAEAQRCIRTLGGQVEQKIDYTIPGTDVTHSALIIRKVADTPAKYPRRWAQIKKSPL